MSRKLQLTAIAVAFSLVASACSDPADPTSVNVAGVEGVTSTANVDAGVIHQVSVGSNDACAAFGAPNGCDGNFSLTAIERADGRVTGQWQDSFGKFGGVHIAVDCLIVYGNQAVVGGVVTKSGLADEIGTRALTAVVDNGRSANDPADQISFSFTDLPPDAICPNAPPPEAFPLNDLTTGQVVVR
jgi:hypothetical protein